MNKFKIAYISDIHIECKMDYLQDIVNKISKQLKLNNFDILLIGGDTSNELKIFESFIHALRKEILKLNIRTKIIFILGNHELWEYAQTFNEITNKYKKVILENKMFFIQNNILYLDSNTKNRSLNEITELELSEISTNKLREKLKKSDLIIFGGIGFSGYSAFSIFENYGETINHSKIVEETKIFEQLYNKICNSIYDKNPIIFTHTPLESWCKSNKNINNFIYVSGHTHDNHNYNHKRFSNVYSNNQIGYKKHPIYLKYFNIEIEQKKSFSNFKDGIYEIKANDYVEFYRNNILNISVNEERFRGKFYLLKKNCYLSFIYKKTKGILSLLFGGKTGEKLLFKDIKYYYDNIEENIDSLKKIKEHLKKYKKFQDLVLKAIKNSGFSECYIDGTKIYINKELYESASVIFINPVDLSIIPYYSIRRKNYFYPNIENLIKRHFPKYRYNKYIKQKKGIESFKYKKNKKIEDYFYYDVNTKDKKDIINKISKKFKRLYALDKNILCTWYETNNNKSKNL